jgi:integrase
MQNRYRLFRRAGGVYYAHDAVTGKQESLRTREKHHAVQMVSAKNQALQQPALNKSLARAYLSAGDPKMLTRTWADVFEAFCGRGRASSQDRSRRAAASTAFDSIRDKPLIETTADDFLSLLKGKGPATNNYLRRFHNLASDLGWLLAPVMAKKAWPPLQSSAKRRGITQDEFAALIKAERNVERRLYYEVLWETGAAQMDAAKLTAENVDWEAMTLIYHRQKLREGSEPCMLRIGPRLAAILKSLPHSGPLFPGLGNTGSKERAAEFRRRCRLLGVKGITLHSFRYSWAERACRGGYPERFAQAALGHASKAVHRAYSRKAKVICPPLEDFLTPTLGRVIGFTHEAAAV